MKRANRRMWSVLTAAAVLTFTAACDNGDKTEQAEIAAELRALRATLQSASTPAPRQTAPDRAALVQALAPLQEALQALANDQRQLAARQIGLTQELQRWTQLVASQATSGTQAELQALTKRLQGLEEAMTAQQAQHAEAEAMVRKALDHTADQLETFLLRLEGASPPIDGDAPGKETPAQPGKEQPGKESAGDATGNAPAAGAAATGGDGAPKRGATGAWLALLLAAFATAGWLWWRRPSPSTRRRLLVDESVGMDEGVEQIWAAAELLGEAVGRLRTPEQVIEPSPARAADESIAVADALGLDDRVFEDTVVEEFVPPAAAPGPAAQSPAETLPGPVASSPAPGQHGVVGPESALFVVPLPFGDQTRAVRALQDVISRDPRVLRRPAPEVVVSAGRAAVRCCLLPTLPPGERSHLEQRLRDAVA
ncbi:MAG: hypothetical protein H6838_17015 [Planctomycetes bacterium]|nr:hypothetical protein [Planctomycetota bacterium]